MMTSSFFVSQGVLFSVPEKKHFGSQAPSLGVCSFLYLVISLGVTELLAMDLWMITVWLQTAFHHGKQKWKLRPEKSPFEKGKRDLTCSSFSRELCFWSTFLEVYFLYNKTSILSTWFGEFWQMYTDCGVSTARVIIYISVFLKKLPLCPFKCF